MTHVVFLNFSGLPIAATFTSVHRKFSRLCVMCSDVLRQKLSLSDVFSSNSSILISS